MASVGSHQMNLDVLSITLAQISFTIKSLTKRNFQTSCTEIAHLVSEHGFEAERHFYRTLVTYLDLQSIEPNSSGTKHSENIHLDYWLKEIPSLISKPNFATLICYAFDTALTEKLLKLSSSSNGFLTSLCKLSRLNRAQELVFVLALQSSTHVEFQTSAKEYIERRLPGFIQLAFSANGMIETGLADSSVEVLHSLLLLIQQYTVDVYAASVVQTDDLENFLNLLRKECSKERIGSNGSTIPLPLLHPSNTSSFDLPASQLSLDSNHLSTSIWHMDDSLADIIREMGYNFTSSVENCRNALVHFGLQESKPDTIARMLSAMIKTHSGLNENTQIYNSNGADLSSDNGKKSLQTWNVDTFVLAINDLIPVLNWQDVVKGFDHPGFFVRDRQALVLLVTALRRAIATELYIDLLYGRWKNGEGQFSWLAQAIRYPDVFCFGDHPTPSVLIDCLRHPLDDTKETWTWRSLNLIECLLRIADAGLYPMVLEIFKYGLQRAGELIFLGLLQLHTVWTTLKQELIQLIIPTFLVNSLNGNSLLNYMWNFQHHTTTLRTTFLTSLSDWYNRANDNEQQQRLSRVLEVVQDLKTLPALLAAQPMTFILDLACLASRRGYLKLDKWLLDKLREHQESFVQIIVQYLRKKTPQLLLSPFLSKDDTNFKPIINAETIYVLLTILQLSLPSIANPDLIEVIQTMLSTAKIVNPSTLSTDQNLARPTSIPLSQQLYHHSTSFTSSSTNPSVALSLTTQLRSLQKNAKRVLPRARQLRP